MPVHRQVIRLCVERVSLFRSAPSENELNAEFRQRKNSLSRFQLEAKLVSSSTLQVVKTRQSCVNFKARQIKQRQQFYWMHCNYCNCIVITLLIEIALKFTYVYNFDQFSQIVQWKQIPVYLQVGILREKAVARKNTISFAVVVAYPDTGTGSHIRKTYCTSTDDPKQ